MPLHLPLTLCLVVAAGTAAPADLPPYAAEHNAAIAATPEAQRAWPLYVEATSALSPWPGPNDNDPARSDNAHQTPAWPAARTWLDENARALDLLRQAAARPHLAMPLTTGQGDQAPPIQAGAQRPPLLIEVLLPHLPMFHSSRRILHADLHLAIEQADAGRITADIEAVTGMAEHAWSGDIMIEQLVACTLVNSACKMTSDAIWARPGLLSDDHLARLDQALLGQASRRDLRVRFDSDRAVLHDLIEQTYAPGLDGKPTREGWDRIIELIEGLDHIRQQLKADGQADAADGPQDERTKDLLWIIHGQTTAPRSEVLAFAERLFAAAEQCTKPPLWQRDLTAYDTLSAELNSTNLKYAPLRLIQQNVRKVYLLSEQTLLTRDGARVGVALERFRLTHGRYPAALQELTPHYLESVPLDRFTGRPLLYKLNDGKPLVYSAGADEDDDGGTPLANNAPFPTGDWFTAGPTASDSYDFILWPVPE